MSYYYKYNFISPEPVYATIKEELKSYFDTGSVDDLLFPTYLDKCLRKLGRSSYIISEQILEVEDFEARLPDNFFAVREAWMCAEIPLTPYDSANSFYSQSSSSTIQIAPIINNGQYEDGCNVPENTYDDEIKHVYKTNTQQTRGFKQMFLLKPGNISARKNCSLEYTSNFNPHSSLQDSFDIRDNKFVTNFRNGVVYLIFYSTDHDDVGNQLIPDNYRIREYVEAFIKFKVFETLTNQVNDETFNQLQQKMVYYKGLSEEAYILADIEIKKQTSWEKQRRITQDKNRNNMYQLPSYSNLYRRRRNN